MRISAIPHIFAHILGYMREYAHYLHHFTFATTAWPSLVHTPEGASLSIFVHGSWGQNGQIYSFNQRLGSACHPSCTFTPRHLALRNIQNRQYIQYTIYKYTTMYKYTKVGICSTPKLCFHPSSPCSPQYNQPESPAAKTGANKLLMLVTFYIFLHHGMNYLKWQANAHTNNLLNTRCLVIKRQWPVLCWVHRCPMGQAIHKLGSNTQHTPTCIQLVWNIFESWRAMHASQISKFSRAGEFCHHSF